MKDSKEYSRKLHKLHRSLKRKYAKPQKIIYEEPLQALVYAVISENMTGKAAQSAMKRISDNFVDLNDLRVSLSAEIMEVLGEDTSVTRNTASSLTKALRAVFNRYNTISLEELKKMGKRPARHALEQLDGTSTFVVDYCMLTSLQGHSIPLTKNMVQYLLNNEIVHPASNEQEIEGFLTRQISARNGYEFYALLRQESESPTAGGKDDIKVEKTKTKVARKTKTKKTTRRKTKKVKKKK
jgi:endonuclease III